jgi:hypothetical protein
MNIQQFRQLCTPSKVYFALSIFFIILAAIQNIGCVGEYHLGHYSCSVPSTLLVFTIKLIYIVFWTWVLNLICKDGHKMISWFLVLFPIILMFVLLGALLLL